MNLLCNFKFSGAPVIVAAVVATPVPERNELFYILREFDNLNLRFNEAKAWVDSLTARITAVENAVSGNTLIDFAAFSYQRETTDQRQYEIILDLCAAASIATVGPALLARATALWLTPLQSALQTYSATWQAQLKAAGRI
jgi:hypothetical protein